MSAISKKIETRASVKSAVLAAKRTRAENAHADAIAYCEANKVRGTERLGAIAFASTAMQPGAARGAIAHAILSPGKSGTRTFREIAKAAKVSLSDMSRANLAYIAHNVEFRRDLVGFVVSFDMSAETVTVRPYKAVQTAPRKARKAKPVHSDKAAQTALQSQGDNAA